MTPILGWDVGGAHLKLARLGANGRLEAARVAPCALWRGLDELETAFDALSGDIPPGAVSAVTMTGELVDLWPDRATGVAALAERLSARLGDAVTVYAGQSGFVPVGETASRWADVASANWRATAQALAQGGAAGLLIDIGSTTTDVISIARSAVLARGGDDAGRLVADELVYLGVARTPVMAIAQRVPFSGSWIAPMAEHFATSADVFRITGDLPDGADLHPAADGRDKTPESSARRLLRMVGTDLGASTRTAADKLAAWLAEAVLRRVEDAASLVLSRPDAPENPIVYGAGVGRFLAARVAQRLGLLYRDVGSVWSDDPVLAAAAADCAPAVAVALLHAGGAAAPAPPRTAS